MQYRSGSVSISTGSNSLIGHDVDWSDIPVDSIFAVPLTPGTHRVQRVVSPTEIELASVWTAAPLVEARYWITTDFTPFNGLPLPGRGDLESTRIISEALIALDGLVGGAPMGTFAVLDKDLNTAPASPTERASYIIGTAPTGVWQNRAGQIATFRRGLWTFATASDGAFVKVVDENKFYAYRESTKTWELNPLTNVAPPTWTSITGKPTTFTPSAHVHAASDVTTGTFHLDRIPVIPATKISGVLSIDQIPIIPSQKQFAAATLAALTTAQQAEIGQGSVVTTDDGYRSIYKGSGSKTDPANYTVLADITPEWNAIANRPTIFPSNIANVSGLQTELTNLQNSINSKSITWAAIPDKPTTLMRTDLVNTITGGRGATEGGELRLARPETGTTIQGDIALDVNSDRLRFLETQGGNRGAYLPFSSLANGADSRIWTSSDFGLTTFADRTHTHAIADTSGLQAALDATLKRGEEAKALRYVFATGNAMFYTDNHGIYVRTGAAGAEKYFDFRPDGSFWSRNGPIYSGDNRVWDAGNLSNPATLGNNNFTGNQRIGTTASEGWMTLKRGSAGGPGYVEFYGPDGNRWGYIGHYNGDSFIRLQSENGRNYWFSQRPSFAGATPWDTANLTPADLNVRNQFRNRQIIADAGGRQLKIKTDQGALNYGAMWHLDATRFYLLLTDKDAADSDFNALRPFHVGMADGSVVVGQSLEVQGNGLNVTGAGATISGVNGLAVTNTGGLRITSGNGKGLRFWDNDNFKIYMSAANDASWGGRVATPYDPETTSDYNIYFRNGNGGTNRGFIWKIDNTPIFGLASNGFLRSLSGGTFSDRVHFMSKTVTADVWNAGVEIQEVGNVRNTQNHHSYAPALTFHWKNVAARALYMGSDAWLYVGQQGDKANLGNLGVDRISSGSSELWLDKGKVTKLKLTDFGASVEGVLHVQGNDLKLYGNSPTVRFVDSDHRSAMAHVNSSRFYVLRGSGNGADGWESYNDGWPLELNLDNCDLRTAGQIYAGKNCWVRVSGNGGYYFENYGGGWNMTDASWMRCYGDKAIVTGSDIQANDFIVTSDRRLKTNIVPLTGSRELIQKTETKSYEKRGRAMVGLIAQEVQEYAPHMVREGGETLEDGTPALTLDLMQFIPHLLAEVKALRQEVETLKAAA